MQNWEKKMNYLRAALFSLFFFILFLLVLGNFWNGKDTVYLETRKPEAAPSSLYINVGWGCVCVTWSSLEKDMVVFLWFTVMIKAKILHT